MNTAAAAAVLITIYRIMTTEEIRRIIRFIPLAYVIITIILSLWNVADVECFTATNHLYGRAFSGVRSYCNRHSQAYTFDIVAYTRVHTEHTRIVPCVPTDDDDGGKISSRHGIYYNIRVYNDTNNTCTRR